MSRKSVISYLAFCFLYMSLSHTSVADEWIRQADMPEQRWAPSSAVVGRIIYVIGGANGFIEVATVDEYDTDRFKWTTTDNMRTPRHALSVCAVEGKLYVIGGGLNLSVSDLLEVYDTRTGKWTVKVHMPTPRAFFGDAVLNDRIYAIGGVNENGRDLDVVEEYDPVSNAWSAKASLSTPRRALSSVAVAGKIYVLGGIRGNTILSTVEEYDPATNNWIARGNMPEPRTLFDAVEINDIVYIFGGRTPGGVRTAWAFNPREDSWTKISPLPSNRRDFTASAVDGTILAMGGYDDIEFLSMVEVYDTTQIPYSVTFRGKASLVWSELKVNARSSNGRLR